MTHTPGPWRVGKVGEVVVADLPFEGAPDGYDAIDHYGGYLVAESVAPGNRLLIAAAPDLLEALRELLAAGEYATQSTDDVSVMLRLGQATDRARAVIATIEDAQEDGQ
jgi:hypothetical protein